MTHSDPAPEDNRLFEMLAAADEALDAFDPIMEKRAWDALAARLDILGPILSPETGPSRDPAGHEMGPSWPARIGRYEVIGELGTGGFGIVFRAFDPKMRRSVALKVPRPELLLMSEGRQRFLREAQAAGSLDHPGIVPVYDAGEIGHACFIASACCEGPDLGVWLKDRTEAVPYPLAAHIVARLADAMSYTHERGILHRDIKPSNVLLFPEADEGQAEHAPTLGFSPRLGDFGLARLAEEQSVTLTRSGLPLGSPPYMSPEQAAGRIHLIGPATDIYALGALLYEVVTGQPPFCGATNLETLRLVTDTDPVAPRMLRSGLPRDLETIILTCLQKVPARRYGSAAALRDDLRRYLAGRPILARLTPPWEHVLKAARRHPAVAAIVATAAMLAIGGGAMVIWSNARLRSYAAELERQRDRADGLHYASQLQLARRARDEGQLGRGQQLLREVRLGPDAPDRREFAWRYLWSNTRREAVLIGETDSLIQGGTLSRDGRLLILSDHAGLSGFDLRSDRLVWADPHSGGQTIDSLNLDPRGHLLAVAYGEKNADGSHKRARVELREAATGRLLVGLPPLPGRVVLDVKLPGDDGSLAVHHASPGTRNGATVAVWTVGGDPDHRRPKFLRQREGLHEVTFAPDGRAFVARESEGRVGLFETATLEKRAELSDALSGLTLPAQFAPDGHGASRSVLARRR
jgi:serine/threonine protein kinase